MTFSTLAGRSAAGSRRPASWAAARSSSRRRKFLYADGGHRRLVWMPKELKDAPGQDLRKRFAESRARADLLDKIADETVATEAPSRARLSWRRWAIPHSRCRTWADSRSRPRIAGGRAPPARRAPRPTGKTEGLRRAKRPGTHPSGATAEGRVAADPGGSHRQELISTRSKTQIKAEYRRRRAATRQVAREVVRRHHRIAEDEVPGRSAGECHTLAASPHRGAIPADGRPAEPRWTPTAAAALSRGIAAFVPQEGRLRDAGLDGQARRAPRPRAAPAAAHTASAGPRAHAVPPLGRRDAQPPPGRHGSLRSGQREISRRSCGRSMAICSPTPPEMAKVCVEKYGADLISRAPGRHAIPRRATGRPSRRWNW